MSYHIIKKYDRHVDKFLCLQQRTAFTLAEVLITLAIIGIVAALTIPTLIEKHQKHRTVVQLKKAYSVMSNAFEYAENEFGPIYTWDDVPVADMDNETFIKFVDKYLKPSLKSYEYKQRPKSIYPIKTMAPTSKQTLYSWDQKWVYLNDGTCFKPYASARSIIYDINGDSKPNIVGKDLFVFTFRANHGNKFKMFRSTWGDNSGPMTAEKRTAIINSEAVGHSLGCNKIVDTIYNNASCGALIQYDGWKISPDYPW